MVTVTRAICANEATSSLGTITTTAIVTVNSTSFNLTGFSGSNYVPVNSVIYSSTTTKFYYVTAVASVNATTCTVTVSPPISTQIASGASIIVHADNTNIFSSIQQWLLTTTIAANTIELGECYKGAPFATSPGASSIITPVLLTASATAYRHLRVASGHEYNPVDRTGVYIYHTTAFTVGVPALVDIREDYFRFEGFAVLGSITTETTACYGIRSRNKTSGGVPFGIQILRCFVKFSALSTSSSSASFVCLYLGGSTPTSAIVRNCIATAENIATIGGAIGIYNHANGGTIQNCSVYGMAVTTGTGRGFLGDEVSQVFTNCIATGSNGSVGQHSDFFVPSSTTTYCMSEDTSLLSFGSVGITTGQSGEAVYNYPAYDDLRLKYTSPAADIGTNLSVTFTNDYAGATRTGLWDLGAYNGVVNEPSVPPTVYIHSIGSASRDYATITAWENATRLHLVSANAVYIGELYDDSEFDHGSTEVTISGAICDATRYRELRPADNQRYDPISDSGVRIKGTNGTSVLKIAENYFRLSGVQVQHTSAGNTNSVCLRITSCSYTNVDGVVVRGTLGSVLSSFRAGLYCDYGSLHQISNCIAIGSGTTTGLSNGFLVAGSAATVMIANCIAYLIANNSVATAYGFRVSTSANGTFYNCIAASNGVDYYTTSMETYMYACISSDTTAVGQKAQISKSAGTVFYNAGSGDFRLKVDSPANNAGVPLADRFTTDISGATRSVPWECGVYNGVISELDAAGIELFSSLRLATCWKIERKDGYAIFVTDHNTSLTVYGDVYSPAGGFNSSVVRREFGMKTDDTEYEGLVTSDLITHEDLFAGKYSRSKVTEYVVDWRYPWAAPQITAVYWIKGLSFDEEVWKAEVAGLSYVLQQPAGSNYSRQCRVRLYSAKCGVLESAYRTSNATVDTVTSRRIFAATSGSISGSFVDDYFKYGKIVWKTGDNVGIECEVKEYTQTGRIIELQMSLPFDVQSGDLFDISAGCAHTQQGTHGCKLKFNNLVNYRGFREIPGTDAQLDTPMR